METHAVRLYMSRDSGYYLHVIVPHNDVET